MMGFRKYVWSKPTYTFRGLKVVKMTQNENESYEKQGQKSPPVPRRLIKAFHAPIFHLKLIHEKNVIKL